MAEAVWIRPLAPGDEELMEKHRAKCSVEGGLEVKNKSVSL